MKLTIKETGKEVELKFIGKNGTDDTRDLLGNHDALNYNEELQEYTITQSNFEWWSEYINNRKQDERDVEELAEELNISESEIWNRIYEEFTNDLGDEHDIIQNVIVEIKENGGIENVN